MSDTKYTPWQLAHMAGCMDPDSVDSPGARWLQRVADDAEELVEEAETSDLDGLADSIHERADSAVPIYTHERFQVFVDLAAYREDLDDLGGTTGDMEKDAGVALYLIAERLMREVIEEITNTLAADDDDDDDDED